MRREIGFTIPRNDSGFSNIEAVWQHTWIDMQHLVHNDSVIAPPMKACTEVLYMAFVLTA